MPLLTQGRLAMEASNALLMGAKSATLECLAYAAVVWRIICTEVQLRAVVLLKRRRESVGAFKTKDWT